jgi:hypothetical protein
MSAMDMDVMSIASSYTGMKQSQLQSSVQTQMLRASMDSQAQAAQELLKSLPQNQMVSGPANLGRNIDAKF